jgi:hypothetical protein
MGSHPVVATSMALYSIFLCIPQPALFSLNSANSCENNLWLSQHTSPFLSCPMVEANHQHLHAQSHP